MTTIKRFTRTAFTAGAHRSVNHASKASERELDRSWRSGVSDGVQEWTDAPAPYDPPIHFSKLPSVNHPDHAPATDDNLVRADSDLS